MSKKKQGGKTKQQKRPNPKYLGIKMVHGQKVQSGNIIVRQRGTKISAGKGVKVGRDQTLYASTDGIINFTTRLGKKYVGIK